MPINFVKAGADCAECFKVCFAGMVVIVEDVYVELCRKFSEVDGLEEFLEGWSDLERVALPTHVTGRVASVLKLNAGLYSQSRDRGETATVFYAEYARDEATTSEEFEILVDDHGGKALAKDRELIFWDTPTTVCHMVAWGAITVDQARKVWTAALPGREQRDGFGPRLESVIAEYELTLEDVA